MAETLRWQQIWKNRDWAIESVDVFCSMETLNCGKKEKDKAPREGFVQRLLAMPSE